MTIYSTELFQALSRLLRRRLSCFWFIFYYVSAMFIKRDTVIINKTTFTVMLFLSSVYVCVWRVRVLCLFAENPTRLTLFMEQWHRLLTMPGSLFLAGSRCSPTAITLPSPVKPWNNNQYVSLFHSETESARPHFRIRLNQGSQRIEKHFLKPHVPIVVWS